MNSKRLGRNLFYLLVLLSNIGCDQVSKTIVRREITDNETVSIVQHYFVLTKVENAGAFLSIGSALPDLLKFILLSIIPLLALSYGIVYLFTRKHLTKLSAVALSFAIGGGIGNIYDRIIHGSVTDFLHIDLGFFQTGIFNMADVSISVALILFVLQNSMRENKKPIINRN
ncbi:MAG TPA: signal peptidase II [Dyadobacter sp.]|jgi:signal peptidase II|nr:signal peptidase II [Dyadobacter sp.]